MYRYRRMPKQPPEAPHLVTVLSVQQPYAHLLMRTDAERKPVENRSWKTRWRGTLWIHASQSRARVEECAADPVEPGKRVEPGTGATFAARDLAYGKVLGCVDLVDILRPEELVEKYPALRGNPHVEGPWCWVLSRPRVIEPFALRGAQGLFGVAGPGWWREVELGT